VSKKVHSFKVGHVYAVTYDDHWSIQKVYDDDEDGACPQLRAIGVVTKQTATTVVVEDNRHMTDKPKSNQRHDNHGILLSAIRKVQHFGALK
jgi:hypothetical protein